MTLRVNGMLFREEEVMLLKKLFGHPDCRIQNLEMEELEVVDDMSSEVINAVSLLKRLFTFDFSNNQLSHQMTSSIVDCIRKY